MIKLFLRSSKNSLTKPILSMHSGVIINIYHHGSRNIGDSASAPTLYFEFEIPSIRIAHGASVPAKPTLVIFGGGALPGKTNFQKIPEAPTVLWGAGFTDKRLLPFKYNESHVSGLDLVGLRDKIDSLPLDWVPCPSCMSPLFNQTYKTKYPVVIYDNPRKLPLASGAIPHMSNVQGSMAKAVDFIASGETVVTSSYHGMYWAMLLGRKVVVLPFGAKFFGLRMPILFSTPKLWTYHLPLARAYPGFLQKCRAANQEFAKKVRFLLRKTIEP